MYTDGYMDDEKGASAAVFLKNKATSLRYLLVSLLLQMRNAILLV